MFRFIGAEKSSNCCTRFLYYLIKNKKMLVQYFFQCSVTVEIKNYGGISIYLRTNTDAYLVRIRLSFRYFM